MGFEISQIKEGLLRDAAIVADSDGNGVVKDNEISIFLNKACALVNNGLCSAEEYQEILGYCPQEHNTRGGVLTTGTKEYVPNESAQQAYFEEFNLEIEDELKKRELERTDENVITVTEIIKKKKDLNIQIKLQEARIDALKQQKPTSRFEKRNNVALTVSMPVGAIAGACAGFKIGAFGGPVGMAIGAFVGGVAGAFVGGFAGLGVAQATISEGDKANVQQEINEEITTETKKLEKLKIEYEKLD